MNSTIVFDTETNGLPKNYKAPFSDVANWPRMVQLSWHEFVERPNGDFDTIGEMDFIIKPEGFDIPKDCSDLHGITLEIAMEKGTELEKVLNIFCKAAERASTIVCHNLNFDINILGAEMTRKNIFPIRNVENKICTMKASTELCKLSGRYGYKWPKLDELHEHLFGVSFEGAHNSANDVSATVRCYRELKRTGVL